MKHHILTLLAAAFAALPLFADTTWIGNAGDGKTATEVRIALARPFPDGRTAVVLDFHGKGFLDKKSRNSELFDVLSFSFE